MFLFINILIAQEEGGRYIDKLNDDSELIDGGVNYTVEVTYDGKFIKKKYDPETRNILRYTTYKSEELKIKEGQFYVNHNDGSSLYKGVFKEGKKNGFWKEDGVSEGYYINGERDGIWIERDEEGHVYKATHYLAGVIKQAIRDSTRFNPKTEIFKIVDEMPRFPGCEDEGIKPAEREKCANKKMLMYIYNNTVFEKEEQDEIVTTAVIVQFVVGIDGSISNVHAIRGSGTLYDKVVLEVIRNMPSWIPGKLDGEVVRVQYSTLVKLSK